MKQILSFFLSITLLACTTSSDRRHSHDIQSLPSFNLLLVGSNRVVNSIQITKGHPSIFVYFRTDCPHCRAMIKNILQHIDVLNETKIFFLTYMPLDSIVNFNSELDLNGHNNISIGMDIAYSFAKAFKPNVVPYVAIYNSQEKLVKIYKGEISISQIYKAVHNNLYSQSTNI